MAEEDPAAAEELARLTEGARYVEVDPAFEWIWRAWWRLQMDREMTGIGLSGLHLRRIPWTTLAAWCDWHGHGPAELDLLDHCVQALDRTWIEHMCANMKGAV